VFHRVAEKVNKLTYTQLITIKKTTKEVYARPSFDPAQAVIGVPEEQDSANGHEHVPAHRDFREKYFSRFGKGGPSSTEETQGHTVV
jgi:hypothetical protein